MTKNPAQLPQVERFKEAARHLGCDEDKAHFDAALEKIATHKPTPLKPNKKRPAETTDRSDLGGRSPN